VPPVLLALLGPLEQQAALALLVHRELQAPRVPRALSALLELLEPPAQLARLVLKVL